tara:strand:- start:1562 stop:1807 length:246 start_codon:yes stop_codon:yes gene_type:complete
MSSIKWKTVKGDNTMLVKDIQENKELEGIIERQVDNLYLHILTDISKHGRRHHKYTIGKQMEMTKLIINHVILQAKMMEVI